LLAGPFGSFAQQPGKIWRIGFLSSVSRPTTSGSDDPFGAFLQGMRELGYVEGKNVVIEWRFADGRVEDLPGLAAELVQSKVDVILTAGTPATSAAQKATATIPIVMGPVSDPIGSGFVKSFAQPGGNITGISNLTGDIGAKYLEILLSMVPKLSRVAVLTYPANSSHDTILKSIRAAGEKTGVEVLSMAAQSPQEIENAFSMMTKDKSGAVIVAADQYFLQQRSQIAALAVENRLPSILNNREYAEAGGLCSYGVNVTDQYRRAATYVDKILRGAKPRDLPVEQPTTFQLVINRKTAKALGLTIPQSLLISADKVID
jgi:putative ABC transport system substrate-binding protein